MTRVRTPSFWRLVLVVVVAVVAVVVVLVLVLVLLLPARLLTVVNTHECTPNWDGASMRTICFVSSLAGSWMTRSTC